MVCMNESPPNPPAAVGPLPVLEREAVAAPGRSRLLALIVATTFFMENLDGTVIATAMPKMAQSFAVNPVDLGIGMTVYLLTLAAFIPLSGWMADRYGARSVFGGAIAVFTIASALCGISDGLISFVLARCLQGIAGAMMVPVGRLVVLRATPKEELIEAIAYLSWPGLVAPILGPPLGGFITTYASWRWIFYLNLPIGLAGIVLVAIFVPNQKSGEARPFDFHDFVLTSSSLICFMYGTELIGRQSAAWSVALGWLAAGIVLGAVAVRHARRQPTPLLDLSLLGIRTFAANLRGGALCRITIGSVPFLLPLMFQVAFGLDAFTSGLLVLSVFAGNLGMKPLTTPLLRRFGFRGVLIGNGLVLVLTFFAFGLLSPGTPMVVTALVGLASGLCRSMQFTGLTTLCFADVPAQRMSAASTFSSMIQQITMGLGVAFGAAFLHLVMLAEGNASHLPTVADFRWTFLAMGLVALAGTLDFVSLDRRAGAVVSGQKD